MELEVGDLVMCTVDRIVGTVVFVKIDGYGEGGIIMSEIAPGRIRNLRDYVVPKKRIACKVLRISGNRIDLSLRRVTPKEKKELVEQEKQEKTARSILRTILKDDAEKIIQEISEHEKVSEFLQEAKENSEKLEKVVGNPNAQKILDIIKSQKQKTYIIKKELILVTTKPDGIILIKEILGNSKEIEIKYIHAGKYILKAEANNPKIADNQLREIVSRIEKQSKKYGMRFEVKDK